MFKTIRKRIGKHYLEKEQCETAKVRRVTNILRARKIGILYTLDNISDYEVIEQVVSGLQQEQKEIKALGYVSNISLVSRFLPKLSYDFISSRDLTWYYKPLYSHIRDFLSKDFDLLIDLSLQDCLPLQFISQMSNTLCRVGRYSEDNTMLFDVMIEVRPGMSVNEYFRQVRHYLTLINPS